MKAIKGTKDFIWTEWIRAFFTLEMQCVMCSIIVTIVLTLVIFYWTIQDAEEGDEQHEVMVDINTNIKLQMEVLVNLTQLQQSLIEEIRNISLQLRDISNSTLQQTIISTAINQQSLTQTQLSTTILEKTREQAELSTLILNRTELSVQKLNEISGATLSQVELSNIISNSTLIQTQLSTQILGRTEDSVQRLNQISSSTLQQVQLSNIISNSTLRQTELSTQILGRTEDSVNTLNQISNSTLQQVQLSNLINNATLNQTKLSSAILNRTELSVLRLREISNQTLNQTVIANKLNKEISVLTYQGVLQRKLRSLSLLNDLTIIAVDLNDSSFCALTIYENDITPFNLDQKITIKNRLSSFGYTFPKGITRSIVDKEAYVGVPFRKEFINYQLSLTRFEENEMMEIIFNYDFSEYLAPLLIFQDYNDTNPYTVSDQSFVIRISQEDWEDYGGELFEAIYNRYDPNDWEDFDPYFDSLYDIYNQYDTKPVFLGGNPLEPIPPPDPFTVDFKIYLQCQSITESDDVSYYDGIDYAYWDDYYLPDFFEYYYNDPYYPPYDPNDPPDEP